MWSLISMESKYFMFLYLYITSLKKKGNKLLMYFKNDLMCTKEAKTKSSLYLFFPGSCIALVIRVSSKVIRWAHFRIPFYAILSRKIVYIALERKLVSGKTYFSVFRKNTHDSMVQWRWTFNQSKLLMLTSKQWWRLSFLPLLDLFTSQKSIVSQEEEQHPATNSEIFIVYWSQIHETQYMRGKLELSPLLNGHIIMIIKRFYSLLHVGVSFSFACF